MPLFNQADIIECIPNVSVGKNRAVLTEMCQAITAVKNTQLLHIESNSDADRSVFTFVGPSDAVLQSAENLTQVAQEKIDMSQQKGVHPRIGALDVCPFVNLGTSSDLELTYKVQQWAEKISHTLSIPIYLYEQNASSNERQNLANIRRGNYEGLELKMQNPNWKPDFGGADFNPTFGAMVTGARELLVALNISLPGLDLSQAKQIASEIRASSKSQYKLTGVKAIGWYMDEYGVAQVSTNITQLTATGLYDLIQTVVGLATRYTEEVNYSTELIGLMPKPYLQGAMDDFGLKDYSSLKQKINLITKAIGVPTIEYQIDHPQKWEVLLEKAIED